MVILCLTFSVPVSHAQHRVAPEYQVKAAFLFNFTRFIHWPQQAFTSPDAPFVIGVIGNNPFGNFLEQVVAHEKIDNHPIKVVHYKSIKDLSDCHMLYINTQDSDKIKNILEVTAGRNILTVSDASNFEKWGGHIRFFKELDKIRLTINASAARESRLTISSKLLGVAQIY